MTPATKPASILLVDDEYLIRWAAAEHLARRGHQVTSADSGQRALEILAEMVPDLVLLDIRMPGIDGIAVLRHALLIRPELPVVMISAHASVDDAVGAMKLGAVDFLVKPFTFQALDESVERALLAGRLRKTLEQTTDAPGDAGLIGESAAMADVRRLVSRCAAAGSTTILVSGESGSGKEVIVRAIHAASPRRDRPFLQINCAALPEQLVESELFGHERGAFTSANARKTGIVESAEGGTVFLDEVGELHPSAQGKLLQLLENKTYRRVGGVTELRADVRVLAATNVDLKSKVSQGAFRTDLYYRLNVVCIRSPALRERPSDIPMLAAHFISRHSSEMGGHVRDISTQALEILAAHSWPGNVRELRNVIERAMILHPEATELRPEHLPAELRTESAPLAARSAPGSETMELDVSERRMIVDALNRTNGNQSKAARILGVTRDTLRYRMKRHGIV